MDTQKFIKAENVDMLWEILLDEPFKNTPKEEMNNLRQYFNNEIKLFYNTQINNKTANFNLLSLNQMFLEKIVPQQNHGKQQQQPQQPQSYKAEDLQADRMSQFENQLTQKRQEFENAIRQNVDKSVAAGIPLTPNLMERMVRDGGGVEFVKRLLHDEMTSGDMKSGFRKLEEHIPHKVDLSFEYLVSRPNFEKLFSNEEVEFCKKLMKKYNL